VGRPYDGRVTKADPLAALASALAEVAGVPVELERPADAAHGDYATNVAMKLAGVRRQAPRDVAADLAPEIDRIEGITGVEVAGPGFLNLTVDDAWLAAGLAATVAAGRSFGGGSAAPVERVQVELVSANPTGPITVASARNGAYGDAVARLLEFAGHDVEREYYYNDAGAQMDRFRSSVEAYRRGEEPPEDGYQGAYVAALAHEADDPVPRMLERIETSLARFRVHFDTFERESAVEAEIPAALAALDTYEADGALWARTSAHGDDKDRVVVRSDGSTTYFAADAAYIERKFARGFDRLVYVLGADHHGYVARLAALAEMLGHPRESVEVLIYQLVHLTQGGASAKMSKRRGDVVFLDDFLDEIGVDAARWYLLARGHDQTIEIDVDLAAERSQKNPVYYVQYAHARIAGVLRNAAATAQRLRLEAPSRPLAAEERDLVKRLLELPEVVREATARRAPHAIPAYAIRVADDFHRFYHHHRVLGSDAESFRLGLCVATGDVVATCLDLLGIEAPERM
jgi:arginyl-tRNA synthetase